MSSSPSCDQQEPINGGDFRSSASPFSTCSWIQGCGHLLQKITQEDSFVQSCIFCVGNQGSFFFGKWENMALNLQHGKWGNENSILKYRSYETTKCLSLPVTRQCTEWEQSCNLSGECSIYRMAKRTFLIMSKAGKWPRVSRTAVSGG